METNPIVDIYQLRNLLLHPYYFEGYYADPSRKRATMNIVPTLGQLRMEINHKQVSDNKLRLYFSHLDKGLNSSLEITYHGLPDDFIIPNKLSHYDLDIRNVEHPINYSDSKKLKYLTYYIDSDVRKFDKSYVQGDSFAFLSYFKTYDEAAKNYLEQINESKKELEEYMEKRISQVDKIAQKAKKDFVKKGAQL